MLTDEQMKNGIINPPRRWPNGEVPLFIDNVFSEYCSTNIQIGMRGVELNIHSFRVTLHLQGKLEVEWTKKRQ
jgi:hypothetical protein